MFRARTERFDERVLRLYSDVEGAVPSQRQLEEVVAEYADDNHKVDILLMRLWCTADRAMRFQKGKGEVCKLEYQRCAMECAQLKHMINYMTANTNN